MDVNYFTILYWFWHTSTWIHHRCTSVPHPEPPFPPHTIPLGHHNAPAPSIHYQILLLDLRFETWFKTIRFLTCFHLINYPFMLYVPIGTVGYVMGVYVPRFFVSSQQRFGVTDIKAPSACHSSRVLDRSCYSSQPHLLDPCQRSRATPACSSAW